jgi:hypothetical protein
VRRSGFWTKSTGYFGALRSILRSFQGYEFGTRRAFLNRFPYFIVFRERDLAIQIIAIAHGRRRPAYWQDRVQ